MSAIVSPTVATRGVTAPPDPARRDEGRCALAQRTESRRRAPASPEQRATHADRCGPGRQPRHGVVQVDTA